MNLGQIYSDLFRMRALGKSMNWILFQLCLALLLYLSIILFRYILMYMVLKWISAPLIVWIYFWVQIPIVLFAESFGENYYKKLNADSNRIQKRVDDIRGDYL